MDAAMLTEAYIPLQFTAAILQPFHQLQYTSSLRDSPACWFRRRLLYKPVEQVGGMSRLVGSHEFVSQGILVAMGTGTWRLLLELGDKPSLEHSELCVFLIYIQNKVVTSVSLYNIKIISALHQNGGTR
jgi:hypothetical protein